MEFTREELVEFVKGFEDKLDKYNQDIIEVKNTINDFFQKADDNYNAWDDTCKRKDFKERNADTLGSLEDDVKEIEGQDFDIYKQVYDDYNATDKTMEEAEYVAGVVENIKEQINKIKAESGADTVEVKVDSDGDVEVKADGEKVVEEESVGESNGESDGESEDSGKKESGDNGDNEDNEEDEIDKELEAAFEKYNNRYI